MSFFRIFFQILCVLLLILVLLLLSPLGLLGILYAIHSLSGLHFQAPSGSLQSGHIEKISYGSFLSIDHLEWTLDWHGLSDRRLIFERLRCLGINSPALSSIHLPFAGSPQNLSEASILNLDNSFLQWDPESSELFLDIPQQGAAWLRYSLAGFEKLRIEFKKDKNHVHIDYSPRAFSVDLDMPLITVHLKGTPQDHQGLVHFTEIPVQDITVQGGILPTQKHYHLRLSAPAFPFPMSSKATLQAYIDWPFNFSNVAAQLELHIPTLYAPYGGHVEGSWVLTGPLHQPDLKGHLQVTHLDIPIPLYQTQIHITEGTLFADGTAKAHGRMGEGSLNGQGELHLNISDPLASFADWRLDTQNITLANIPPYHIVASPQLQGRFSWRKHELSGIVPIDKATIYGQDRSRLIRSSSDVVLTHPKNKEGAAGMVDHLWNHLSAHFDIRLGQHTQYQSSGLNADVQGQILVDLHDGQPPMATGTLYLKNGHYQSFGSPLNISRGVLYFNHSPITEPILDLQATRHIDHILVGLSMEGPIHQPHLTLFSKPNMNQENILSYLILGSPSSPGDTLGTQALAPAASQMMHYLGLNSNEGLLGFTKILPLDSIQISNRSVNPLASLPTQKTGFSSSPGSLLKTNTPFEQTEISLSKKLSDHLSLQYNIGVMDGLNTIRLRYLFNKHITFEVTSQNQGQGNGGDVLFVFDR